uniref:Putative ovule protein n=1 Tax=Solanum chacoense TaxID=4108 RepID=A0A0V0HTQ3_SOLCH
MKSKISLMVLMGISKVSNSETASLMFLLEDSSLARRLASLFCFIGLFTGFGSQFLDYVIGSFCRQGSGFLVWHKGLLLICLKM